MVDRYEIQDPGCQVYEEPDGNLVYYSDYAALEQRLQLLEALLGVWENKETFWDKTNKELEDELYTLRAEREELVELHQGQYSGLHADYERFRADNERLKKEKDEMDSKYQDQMLDLEGRLHKHYENLRAKNERLQARLTEQADEFGRQIQSLHLDVAARDGEIERLREALKAVLGIGFTGEDAVDAMDIAKKALGGGE